MSVMRVAICVFPYLRINRKAATRRCKENLQTDCGEVEILLQLDHADLLVAKKSKPDIVCIIFSALTQNSSTLR